MPSYGPNLIASQGSRDSSSQTSFRKSLCGSFARHTRSLRTTTRRSVHSLLTCERCKSNRKRHWNQTASIGLPPSRSPRSAASSVLITEMRRTFSLPTHPRQSSLSQTPLQTVRQPMHPTWPFIWYKRIAVACSVRRSHLQGLSWRWSPSISGCHARRARSIQSNSWRASSAKKRCSLWRLVCS